MMGAQTWNIVLYAAGMVSLLLILLPFSPMTIDLLMFPRDAQISIYRHRHLLWVAGIACLAVVFAKGLLGATDQSSWGALAAIWIGGRELLGTADPVWPWIVGVSAVVLVIFFWSGYVPYVMTPPRRQRVLSVAEADELLRPDDVILGLIEGGEARAYPRDFIARPHFFTDTVAGTPVTVSYCILCNSGIAFKSLLKGRLLNLQSVTAYNNNIIYVDRNTGNFIQQLDGKVIYGPDKGETLDTLPVVLTSWTSWKRLHPGTKVYYAPAITLRDKLVAAMLKMMIPVPKLAKRKKPWHRIKGRLDDRLPAMSFVFGVELHGKACAYPISYLRQNPVVNDTVGDEPIVVVYSAEDDIGYVGSRRIDGKTLMFSPASGRSPGVIAEDNETGSLWDVTGVAREGKFAGRCLERIPHFNKLFWFSWALFKPGTELRPGLARAEFNTPIVKSGRRA